MSRRYSSRRSYRPVVQSYRQRDNHNRFYRTGSLAAQSQEAQAIYQANEPVTITNITIRGGCQASAPADPAFALWALVLVPDSYSPQSIITNDPDANMYEPNQFVLASGLIDSDALVTVRGLNRRLKPGDQIFMITASTTNNNYAHYNIQFTVLH